MSEDRTRREHPSGSNRPDARAFQQWLLVKLSQQLEISPDEIDPKEPLTSYGVGSAEAIGLSGELEEWLGSEIPATVSYDYRTIE